MSHKFLSTQYRASLRRFWVAKAIQGTELKGNLVKRYMKKKDLEVNPVKIELDLSVDQDKVSTFVSEKCGSAVADAVDATITR